MIEQSPRAARKRAKVEAIRRILAKERLNTTQLGRRIGVTSNHALHLARECGLEHLVDVRKNGDCWSDL